MSDYDVRIVHFSDTHGLHKKLDVPEGDILIFSGDCSERGDQYQVEDFFEWFTKKPHPFKIFVPGNHDRCFDNKKYGSELSSLPFWVETLKKEFTRYDSMNFFLQDSACEISLFDLKFFGSPQTPKVMPHQSTYWAFSPERYQLGDYWKNIPNDTDILITHGPAFGKLDFAITTNTHVGCERLRYKIHRVQPKAHLFGHIHEDYGVTCNGKTYFLNSSIFCYGNELNPCQVFDINEKTKEIKLVQ